MFLPQSQDRGQAIRKVKYTAIYLASDEVAAVRIILIVRE